MPGEHNGGAQYLCDRKTVVEDGVFGGEGRELITAGRDEIHALARVMPIRLALAFALTSIGSIAGQARQ